jgi:hypothetical protein
MKKIVILISIFFVSSCFALPPNIEQSVKQKIDIIQSRSTLYLWGAAGDIKEGVQRFDCSGYLHFCFFTSGVALKRTTAYRMRLGLDNWEGKDINIYDVDDLDIPFWSWRNSPNRPFGHVGILLIGKKSKLLEVTHASSTKKKIVMHPLEGVFIRDLSAIRRLTIGEGKLVMKETPAPSKNIIKISPDAKK